MVDGTSYLRWSLLGRWSIRKLWKPGLLGEVDTQTRVPRWWPCPGGAKREKSGRVEHGTIRGAL